MRQACPACRSLHAGLHHLACERLTVVLTQHARARQMPIFPDRSCETFSQRHAPKPAALLRRDLPIPVGAPDTNVSPHEVDICPFERDDFAAAQPRVAAQEHDEVRARVEMRRHLDEPFVFIEVMERGRAFRHRQEPIEYGIRSMMSHSTAFRSSTFSTVRMLLTVFGAFAWRPRFSRCTSSLLMRVQCLVTQRRDQVHPKHHLLRCNPTGLLPIRSCIAVQKPRSEFL